MDRLRRGRWLWVAAVGALALLLSLAALLTTRQPAAAQVTLIEARERWASQPVAAYRLTLTRKTSAPGNSQNCQQEVEVLAEQVTRALSNDCGQPADWTVTRLFDWIAELELQGGRCYPGPARCACQGSIVTSVRYDEALGYPREILYTWRKSPNLMNPAFWSTVLDRSFVGCDRDDLGGEVVYTVSLAEAP